MAGPGGGSRGGGGFSGGGSRGGGFGGGGFRGGHHGGFGGPHHRPPMHHHHWGWGWGFGPRRYYGGGGGCLGILMLPIILILIAVMIFVSVIGGACNAIMAGGQIEYDDKVFQDYVDSQYNKIYGTSTAYEDNILIVFLTSEEAEEYGYYAWVGDHVATDVNLMFGYTGTELGNAMNACVNSGYWYSLDSNLASVINLMTERVTARQLASNFTCTEEHVQVASKLYNQSEFTLTESTVNTALENFTAQTGITVSILVEDMTDVLEVDYTQMAIGLAIVAVLVTVAVILIVKISKKNKNGGNGGQNGNQGNSGNDYARGNFKL